MKAIVQTNFKNAHKASYVARNIANWHNRGSAIEAKIETVLNSLREITDVKSLKDLNNTIVEAYLDVLQDKLENGELTTKTTATYISAANDIIRYVNEHLGKEINIVSAQEHNLSAGHREYTDRSVPEVVYCHFISHLESKSDIQFQALARSVELQRNFGLRLRESLAIKRDTIREALRSDQLRLGRREMTKDARERVVPIRTKVQREVLHKVYNFMRQNHLKSLIPTKTLRQQYSFAQRVRYKYQQQNSVPKFRYHDFRHTFAHNLEKQGYNKKEIAAQLGHGRLEKTYIASS